MPPECSLAPTYDPFSIDGFYIGFAEAVNLLAPTRPVTRRVTSSTTTTRLATASDRPTQPSLTVPRRDRGRLRDLIHGVDPDMTETIKRRDQPYFVLDGNVCALLAAKDHVNLFLYDGAIVPDPDGIITGGHDNKTARTIAYRRGEAVDARPLTAMLEQIVANNRAGGWRKLKTQ